MDEHALSVSGRVSSGDGTEIAYERFGHGSPVILVGGALTSGLRTFPSFVELASLLSSTFTVFTYDRRGRGRSGDTPPYVVDRELDDLDSLIALAGGEAAVHGLSSGAVLAARAAARGAGISRLTLFEPAPSGDEPDPVPPTVRTERIAAGHRREAVEAFLAGVGLSPQAIAAIATSPEWAHLEATARTLPYEGEVTTRWTEVARSVRVPTLVIDSNASSGYLRTAAEVAADVVPTAHRRTIAGAFHDAPAEVLAPILVEFFTSR